MTSAAPWILLGPFLGLVTRQVLRARKRALGQQWRIRYADPAVCESDVKRAATLVVPNWTPRAEEVTVQPIQGGITNLLWKLTDTKRNKSILIRVFGANTELMIDRAREGQVFELLSRSGFAPRLLGTFANGRAEEYIEARSCDLDSMPRLAPLVGHEIARMHSIQEMRPRTGESVTPQIWIMIDKWVTMGRQLDFDSDPARAAMFKSFDLKAFQEVEMIWLADVLPSPKNSWGRDLANVSNKVKEICFATVFCHNDVLGGNILDLSATSKENPVARVQLIDFEYGAYNSAGFDAGNHFCEHAGFEFELERRYPSLETKMNFWRGYLDFKKVAYDDALLIELSKWSDAFALASNAFWFVWAVLQAKHSTIDVDFLDYARKRRAGYFSMKEKYFSNGALV